MKKISSIKEYKKNEKWNEMIEKERKITNMYVMTMKFWKLRKKNRNDLEIFFFKECIK